jgi:mannose-6-phosphate isomerase-like protein (cupin superfamily)
MTPGLPLGRREAGEGTVAPDGSAIRILIDNRHGASRASLCEAALDPNAISRAVRHQTVEEIWYVIEGGGEVWRRPPGSANAEPATVTSGDALVIPTGCELQFRAGSQGLRFLCYTSPPWPGAHEAVLLERGTL